MTLVVPASGAVRDRILDASVPAMSRGLSRRAYARLDEAEGRTIWGGTCRERVALVDGPELLASAVRHRVEGVLDGRPVTIGVISAVLVDPLHDGEGRAEALVEQALLEAARSGMDLAVLCAGSAPRLMVDAEWCARAGFETLPILEAELSVAQSPDHGAPMALVRSGEERDLAAIVAMGDVRAAPFRFHLNRGVDLVQHAITRRRLSAGLGPPGSSQLEFFIAEEGITAAAYVVMTVTGRTWTIEECGDRDGSGARVGALLQALIARDITERRPTIRAWLPPGFVPPQVTIVSTQPAADRLMIRALTPRARPLRLAGDDVLYWRSDLP